ncbi:NAD/NADP-dependent octopine/nopaline dehydrogenase family protein [Roseomonas populi]|uniref:NAD/NADP octopine/nopaline dehydrogenase family protein n=1 Tax=Roseomonas populi TaxID=3121582 RepID=A0ABT1X565_9PROT|nr:NAD/NADP-dependent octopine/nopaline dehydrogenase family protein [Roseomonas pecuniae]MCR0983245.1 NAD/NADP octopine/nopaline dehydrogenase family protein [Roseomonas pecuniae]
MTLRIAVLGGGNGSFAAAGDMALNGHEVRLWRRDAEAVAAHKAGGGTIAVKDAKGTHEARLALVTTDIAEAVRGADLILCPAPATAQVDIARLLAPVLEDGQVVFLPPGTLGTVLMARALHETGRKPRVAFAETGTLPWLARKHGPHQVAITTRATRLPTGVFPLDAADHALAVIAQAFPGAIEPCGDALSGALMNAGAIIHPPLIIMNAGPLEHFEKWDIHNEGTVPAIRRTTDALDAERIAVREALGYDAPHFPLAHHYAKEGEEWMYGRASHDRLTESGDWREKIMLTKHRYMMEDLRLGLSLIISAAELAGVPTPLARAFSSIGAAIRGDAPDHSGRTLADAGLGGLDRAGIDRVLKHGF